MHNTRIVLNKRPSGEVTHENFRFEPADTTKPRPGEVLLKSRYISVDPYMRNRMNDVKSYVAPYRLDQVITGDVIAEIVESEDSAYQKGDIVTCNLPWQEYITIETERLHKIKPDKDIPETAYLGVMGLTGLTAYFGLLDIGQPKKNETVVVSGAAGAVGQIVVQIAQLKGCRVVGIAGSGQKTAYLQHELNIDETINYKEFRNIRRPLRKACPNGVDVYFDNVGGDISDNVIYMLNDYARVVLCGQISMYNSNRLAMGPRLFPLFIIHRVKMQGFIVYDYKYQFQKARTEIADWIKSGKLQYTENIIEGFQNIPQAFLGLFRGDNLGKQIVKVF